MAQGEHQITGVLIPDALRAITLINGIIASDVVPPVIDAAVEYESVEALDWRIREHREIEFRGAVIAFEIHAERMLGIFTRVALRAALDLQAAINLRAGRAVGKNQLHRTGALPAH